MAYKEPDRSVWTLIKNIFKDWGEDNVSLLAAALSYYTFFSLAPLLLVAIGVAGLVFGRVAVEKNVMGQITGMIGPAGAGIVGQLLNGMQQQTVNKWAAIIGGALLLVGASSVFQQLRSALNVIWRASAAKGEPLFQSILDYLLSFGIVILAGMLLLAFFLASAAISVISRYFSSYIHGLAFLWQAVYLVASWAIVTVLFALIFRFLPEVRIVWRDVWVGAAVTALLFTVGKYLIGLYLGHSALSSVYGAAASLVVILLWIYYSSQIFLFGAEFTKEFSRMYGSLKEGEGESKRA